MAALDQPPRRSRRMRFALALGLGSVMVLGLLVPATGSSHREAPLISEDPAADNTDVYAFVDPNDADSVTLISNWVPFQEAGGGPNYYKFGDDVLYSIHVDNDGDAVADITYEWRFTTTVTNPDTYLYANNAPITDIDSDAWNKPQSYTVYKIEGGERDVIASDLLTPPVNVGPRSTPDYESLAQQAVHSEGGRTYFAGQRDEGFYIDIAAIFDLGGLRPFNESHLIPLPNEDGVDTFAGYNVNSIAINVPTDELVDGDDVIGIWSTTSRRKVRVFAQNSSANPVNTGRWVQVSRLGQPLVNEVVVPLEFKDVFNTLSPSQDATVFPTLAAPNAVGPDVGSENGDIPLVTDPILGEQIQALYGVDVPCTTEDACGNDGVGRTDLVDVFLLGLEGVNRQQNGVPAELLRLNTSVAESGFPNGRAVGDDITDTAIQVVAGSLRDDAPPEAAALSDGVQENDVPYLDVFPYLGTPHQGYELNNPARVDNS